MFGSEFGCDFHIFWKQFEESKIEILVVNFIAVANVNMTPNIHVGKYSFIVKILYLTND